MQEVYTTPSADRGRGAAIPMREHVLRWNAPPQANRNPAEEDGMSGLKKTTQVEGGVTTDKSPRQGEGDQNQGAEFGASDRGTRGTNRDADTSGVSHNQGHGHPREQRGSDES